MAERNWNFTKIHIEEMVILANAGRRKSKGGPVVEVPLSGAAIAVYVNLRGRIYATKTGEHRFYCWASQESIAKDLGWNPKKPKNRVSEAINDLKNAGVIKVFIKEDTSKEAKDLRRKLKCGWATSVYELSLLRVALEKEASDSNRDGVPLQSEVVPTTIGGHSDRNRSKEEEVNNKKKEEDSIIKENRNAEILNVRTNRFNQIGDIQDRILDRHSDWRTWIFQDYHYEDIEEVLSGMPKVKVTEEIGMQIMRYKWGLQDWGPRHEDSFERDFFRALEPDSESD